MNPDINYLHILSRDVTLTQSFVVLMMWINLKSYQKILGWVPGSTLPGAWNYSRFVEPE